MVSMTEQSFTINVSEQTYKLVTYHARQAQVSPDSLVDETLRHHFSPPHPYVTKRHTAYGEQAIIKGTRVAVSAIVDYTKMGYSPEQIAAEILPHITIAQIYDALSYYYDNKFEIERELAEDADVELWERRLREPLPSEEAYLQLRGKKSDATTQGS